MRLEGVYKTINREKNSQSIFNVQVRIFPRSIQEIRYCVKLMGVNFVVQCTSVHTIDDC